MAGHEGGLCSAVDILGLVDDDDDDDDRTYKFVYTTGTNRYIYPRATS